MSQSFKATTSTSRMDQLSLTKGELLVTWPAELTSADVDDAPHPHGAF